MPFKFKGLKTMQAAKGVLGIGLILMCGLATTLKAQDIYVDNGNAMSEYGLDGSTVNASLITGLNVPEGIALSGNDLFVANIQSGTIGEYTTSGADGQCQPDFRSIVTRCHSDLWERPVCREWQYHWRVHHVGADGQCVTDYRIKRPLRYRHYSRAVGGCAGGTWNCGVGDMEAA